MYESNEPDKVKVRELLENWLKSPKERPLNVVHIASGNGISDERLDHYYLGIFAPSLLKCAGLLEDEFPDPITDEYIEHFKWLVKEYRLRGLDKTVVCDHMSQHPQRFHGMITAVVLGRDPSAHQISGKVESDFIVGSWLLRGPAVLTKDAIERANRLVFQDEGYHA
jgi:hypothetical protein